MRSYVIEVQEGHIWKPIAMSDSRQDALKIAFSSDEPQIRVKDRGGEILYRRNSKTVSPVLEFTIN